jgi:outer membrane protein
MIQLLFGLYAMAAVDAPLRWEDAVAHTQEKNSSLKSSSSETQASEAERKQAYGAFLPSISASARRSGSEVERNNITVKSKSDSLSLTASLNIFSGFSTIGAVRRASLARDTAKIDERLKSVSVRFELRQAFFNLYIQQERIRIYEKTVARQQQNEKLVGLKYESGAEARWNLNKTRADLERARYNLESTKTELELAQRELARIMEVSAHEKLRVAASQDLPPSAKIDIDTLLQTHPRVERSRQLEETAYASRLIARSGFYPSLDLSYSRSREPLERGPYTNTNTWTLSASWNLFNGFVDYHKASAASANREAASYELDAVLRSLNAELNEKQNSYRLAFSLLPVAMAQREAAEERLKTVMAQYRSGLKSYLDWEQADSQLNESEQAEISARKQALFALAELERSLAIPLETL